MDDDLDRTQQEAEATISRLDAAVRQAQELLDRSKEAVGAEASTPGFARAYISRQPKDAQDEFERAVKELNDEIERDLPRQEAQRAKRAVRVKPTRQMI